MCFHVSNDIKIQEQLLDCKKQDKSYKYIYISMYQGGLVHKRWVIQTRHILQFTELIYYPLTQQCALSIYEIVIQKKGSPTPPHYPFCHPLQNVGITVAKYLVPITGC